MSAGTLAGTLAGTEAASAEGRNGSEAPKKPNILFFLVDDLGWSDIGCFGSRFHETPNIDRLAEEGVRFTNAYAACHVSSPTRASLMTGRYPASIRLTDWLPGRKNWPFQRLLNAPVEQHLPFEEITVAETLRDNGYATAIIGKWHLGKGDSNPLAHGFDEHIPLGYNEGWPQGYYAPFRLNGYEGEEGEYLTDVMTREATKYIEEHKDGPFFLYMSHFAVHDPIQGRKDLVEKYRRKLATMHYEGDPYILEGNPDDPDPLTRGELDSLVHTKAYQGYRVLPQRTVKIKQHQDNIEFAAMVEAMDESLGVIRRKLEELGIADNTIVIFYSDNGGMAGANFGRPDRRIAKDALDRAYATSSLPLRGAKGWMYEGGIRVPMIVCYPGVGRADGVRRAGHQQRLLLYAAGHGFGRCPEGEGLRGREHRTVARRREDREACALLALPPLQQSRYAEPRRCDSVRRLQIAGVFRERNRPAVRSENRSRRAARPVGREARRGEEAA